MSDKKKILIIILISIFAFGLYLYQDSISELITAPFDVAIKSFKKVEDKAEIPNPIKEKQEKTKVVVVEEEEQTIKVVEESMPAVVSVVRKEIYFDPFRGPFKSEDSIGTGFVIDGKEGVILTNRHVVNDDRATYSVVIGEGEKTYDVEKVYKDPLNDFAILKINLDGEVLHELKLGDSDKLRVGQTVIAIGNALGEFGNSTTKGIVSGLGRGIVAQEGPFGRAESLDNVIQTDAALNPGNSGGPLLNLQGEVIGINVAISNNAENIGFALPINTLKSVIKTFEEKGKISRPFLGVEYAQITKKLAEQRALPVGAFVRKVVPNSPAEKGGIEPGDIILKVNGIRLDDEKNTLAKVIAQQPTDEPIEIVVDRNGKEVTLKVELEDLEK